MHFQRFGDALQRLPHISNVTAIAVSMHQQHLELREFQEIVPRTKKCSTIAIVSATSSSDQIYKLPRKSSPKMDRSNTKRLRVIADFGNIPLSHLNFKGSWSWRVGPKSDAQPSQQEMHLKYFELGLMCWRKSDFMGAWFNWKMHPGRVVEPIGFVWKYGTIKSTSESSWHNINILSFGHF